MGDEVRFRFVSWNLQWASSREERQGQLDLLRQLDPDVLAVQEVKDTTLRPIAEHFDWKVFALGDNPDDRYWTTRMGTAVLGGTRTTLLGQELIAPTWFAVEDRWRWKANRFSRRATWARIAIDGSKTVFRVGSLHASPAAGDIGAHKPWFHAGVGRWLEHVHEPWLFGIDANGPGEDPPEHADARWGYPQTETQPGEDELLGVHAPHRGRDLLRAWLADHPDEFDRVTDQRPNGPLTISYHLKNGPVRYDHCWATPEIQVRHIEYLTDAMAFSDHAPIVCDLAVSPTPGHDAAPPAPTVPAVTIRPLAPEAERATSDDRPPLTPQREQEIHRWIACVLDDLRGHVRDVRGEPTEHHRGQFTRGWRHAASGGTYGSRTLQGLTWNNLGYRLARDAGEASVVDVEDIHDVFDVAANGFEDGSLRHEQQPHR